MKINRAVCALIQHDDKFLVVTRRHSEGWGLVGGKVDPGETEEQALQREVFEETHLIVEEFFPIYSAVCGAGEDGKAFFTTTYLVTKVEDINDCIQIEAGIIPLWKDIADFTHDKNNKFKDYNTEVINSYLSIYQNITQLMN